MLALVVGAGSMGAHHVRVARSLGVEAYTVDPFRPSDFVSLAAAPAAETVVVATPIATLARVTLAVMRRGCSRVLVEKPMAATLEDAEALVTCARRTATTLLVGYTERFHPIVRQVRGGLLEQVGEVTELRFERRGPARDRGPGPALDLAVHDLDLLRFLGYEPSLTDACFGPAGLSATFDCDGPTASLSAGYTDGGKVRRFSVHGSQGVLSCDLLRNLARIDTATGEELLRADADQALKRQWLALLEDEGPTGEDGLAALRLAVETTTVGRRLGPLVA